MWRSQDQRALYAPGCRCCCARSSTRRRSSFPSLSGGHSSSRQSRAMPSAFGSADAGDRRSKSRLAWRTVVAGQQGLPSAKPGASPSADIVCASQRKSLCASPAVPDEARPAGPGSRAWFGYIPREPSRILRLPRAVRWLSGRKRRFANPSRSNPTQPDLAFFGLISHASVASVGPEWPTFEVVWAQFRARRVSEICRHLSDDLPWSCVRNLCTNNGCKT